MKTIIGLVILLYVGLACYACVASHQAPSMSTVAPVAEQVTNSPVTQSGEVNAAIQASGWTGISIHEAVPWAVVVIMGLVVLIVIVIANRQASTILAVTDRVCDLQEALANIAMKAHETTNQNQKAYDPARHYQNRDPYGFGLAQSPTAGAAALGRESLPLQPYSQLIGPIGTSLVPGRTDTSGGSGLQTQGRLFE